MSEADYIVVLDTGSTDGTYEKLKEDSKEITKKPELLALYKSHQMYFPSYNINQSIVQNQSLLQRLLRRL